MVDEEPKECPECSSRLVREIHTFTRVMPPLEEPQRVTVRAYRLACHRCGFRDQREEIIDRGNAGSMTGLDGGGF